MKKSKDSVTVNGWKWNLIIFGTLILIVIAYFFWQSEQARKGFIKRASDQSSMLAGMISFSLGNALSSQKSIEKTIQIFLTSTAQFIDYLDAIEAFTPEELSFFADEANLAGIRIFKKDGAYIEGPTGWSPEVSCDQTGTSLFHYPEKQLFLIMWPRDNQPGCILAGFDSSAADRLMESIGLGQLMQKMTSLPLIEYVRLENTALRNADSGAQVKLILTDTHNVAETKLPFDDHRMLVAGIDASSYVKQIRQLKESFFFFSAMLVVLGFFFSWLLHRYQSAFLARVRNFDRELARQHREAALGRAAATISHEIKNPLNAIGMGLQRLRMEVDMPEEYNKLLTSMNQAVVRTSGIISDLKQHTKPITPEYQDFFPDDFVESALTLYRIQCAAHRIAIHFTASFHQAIKADKTLFGQLVENLLKNAIEAQPDGGRIDIETARRENHFMLKVANPGFAAPAAGLDMILEPYYTSKTQGTGLGLDVCRRIVEAHNGELRIAVPTAGVLQITVMIPVAPKRG